MKLKKEKGITLIALVVTIVVLLILAGVSTNILFSDSGLIEKAQDSGLKIRAAQVEEVVANWKQSNFINSSNKKSVSFGPPHASGWNCTENAFLSV